MKHLLQSWRWYGPNDPVSLQDIRQAGASGIVTALHHIPNGAVWPVAEIQKRKREIEAAGLQWAVVESLPVTEAIKTQEGPWRQHIANYQESLRNLGQCSIQTVTYNFMPVLDWTRTDLKSPTATGATCLRFEAYRMAAFEVFMLEREGAEADYLPEVVARGKAWFEASTEADRTALLGAIMAGLPGAFDRYDIDGLRGQLALYDGIGRTEIRSNFKRFLDEVVPAAEDLGIRLAVHADDPPRDILGLPRVVSSADDAAWVLAAHDSPANGLTLCAGRFGAHPTNDLPAIARRFGPRIHFAHLRNVAKDPDGSFEEAAHLDGDTDMVDLARALLEEEARRRAEGRADAVIPFRPDHGHEIAFDQAHDHVPGYPLIGRLRGLAELRGVLRALEQTRG